MKLALRSLTDTFKPPDTVKWVLQRGCFLCGVTGRRPPDALLHPMSFVRKQTLAYMLTSCFTRRWNSVLPASDAHSTPALETDSTSDAWASVRCCQNLRPVPRLLQIFHRRNTKYAFYFLKSAESRLSSSAGGREEPKSLSTLQTPPPS